MSTPVAASPAPPAKPTILVETHTKRWPRNVDLLNDWQYLERAVHRLLAAWGRDVADWHDKSGIHRHIWDQAECIRRLRERSPKPR